MKDNRFQELVEEGQWDELETYWLERMESGESEFGDFMEVARLLGRQREKARAAMLMGLLEDHLRDKQRWPLRLRVLKEIIRHTPDIHRLEDRRDQLRDTLQHVYGSRPSYAQLMRQFQFNDQKNSEDLSRAVDHIEEWLKYDVGELFYQPGYGAGRVTEINPKLGILRIDFQKKKDVTVQPGDTELIPIQPGHLLYKKFQSPDEFRQQAEADPSGTLGLLLAVFERPMTVGEIKDCLSTGITTDWSRWWTAAKKNPQVIVSGKGAQAEYSWSDSTSAAEEAVRKEFDGASPRRRMDLARQHVSRGGDLAQHFEKILIQEAGKAYENKDSDLALEMLEVFAKWPGHVPDPGYTFEQIVKNTDPRALLTAIQNTAMKTRVITAYQELKPVSWPEIYSDWFLREDNPKLLTSMFQKIRENDPSATDSLLDRIFASAHAFPGALAWVAEQAAVENLDLETDAVGKRLDGKFLLSVIEAIDSTEFSAFRNRIKKAIESGVLMNVLKLAIDPAIAQKAIEMLEYTRHLEDYRRDRWRNFIRSRIPEIKKKDDVIFSTRESYERKRSELEQLIKVDLPTNRKAVGEAAAHGDLRENHEYKAARERQEYLINRVQQLQTDLGRVRVLEPGATIAAKSGPARACS